MLAYKGEKYIYLLMGYRLAKENKGKVKIGNDNGMRGGFQFERWFKIQEYKGKTLLVETKSSKGFADYSRTFEVLGKDFIRPTIMDYINEDLENCGTRWTH